ncbi:MAG: hypothetical protein ABFC62_01280 [Clostridiaceae bacterium]|nr:hypothetical protein [Eubacteriales bacterium]
MFEELTEGVRSISVIGMCKNAGKTTVFNVLVRELGQSGRALGLTSIGRDGESEDIVTHTHKPGIYVYEGTLVATAENLLKRCDITREILHVTPYNTPMGAVVLMRAKSDGKVQLAGPSITAQMRALKEEFYRFGADIVLIDGAVSRKTLSAPAVSEAAILCTGASYSANMDTTIEDTAHVARLLTLPVQTAWTDEEMDMPFKKAALKRGDGSVYLLGENEAFSDVYKRENARHVYVKGAVTDALMKPVLEAGLDLSGASLSVEDGTKLLLSRALLERFFARGARLSVRLGMRLLAVTVNPVSAYGGHYPAREFLARMKERVSSPVFDVGEGGEA